MTEILVVAIIFVAATYVLLPILIRVTQTIAMRPVWMQTTPQQITPEIEHFLRQMVHQFDAQGFEFRCNVHVSKAVPEVEGFQVLLVRSTTGEMAVLLIASGAANLRALVFAIRSEFADGTWITTGSDPGIGIFPRNPAHYYENFPWIRDAATLCEAHRRVVALAGRSHEPCVAPARGEELAYMDYEWDRSNLSATARGYRYPDPARNLYAFTWKGAYFATWKLAVPVKQIRIWVRNRRARRRWNELGMPAWRPGTPSPPQFGFTRQGPRSGSGAS